MPTTWKDGDKVKLASGGPVMTVKLIHTRGISSKQLVKCQWFDKDGNIQEADFTPESLVAEA